MCVWKEVREVGLHVLPLCAKFGMDRRLVSILVQTNHTLDILVSHPLHAAVSTWHTPNWKKKLRKIQSSVVGVSTAKSGPTLSAEQLLHVSYWRGGGEKGAEGLRIGNSELVIPRETPSCCCLVRVASAQVCTVQVVDGFHTATVVCQWWAQRVL